VRLDASIDRGGAFLELRRPGPGVAPGPGVYNRRSMQPVTVQEQVQYASLGWRFTAVLIDTVVLLGLWIVVLMVYIFVLAGQGKIPAPIIDFIQQHHGTTLVEYFYRQASESKKADPHSAEVDESSFRYPGPKPQSKEAGYRIVRACLLAPEALTPRYHRPARSCFS